MNKFQKEIRKCFSDAIIAISPRCPHCKVELGIKDITIWTTENTIKNLAKFINKVTKQ